MKHVYNSDTNANGEKLLDFCEENRLKVANGEFQKKKRCKLWTWLSPNGTKHQIDYILVRRKWWNSVKNVEVFNTFSSVGSDHRIVSMRLKLN